MLHLDNIDRYMVYVVNNALAEGLATPSRVNHFRGRNLGVRGWMEAQNHTEDRRDPFVSMMPMVRPLSESKRPASTDFG